jgi:hypothetical protein
MTVGRASARLRRWVLWAGLGLIVVLLLLFAARGIGASRRATQPADGGAGVAFPDAEAQAFAASFARLYLTYAPWTVDAQRAALQPMMRSGLDAGNAVAPQPGGDAQRVVAVWPARSKDLGGGHGRVTLACLVVSGGQTRTMYLAVPIGRDARGGLAVEDWPAPVSPPRHGDPSGSDEVDLTDAAAQPIKDLLGRFMPAYLAGQPVPPQFIAPGGSVDPLEHAYELREIVGMTQAGPPTAVGRIVLVTVRINDTTTTTQFTARYRVLVAKPFDRWLIKRIQD